MSRCRRLSCHSPRACRSRPAFRISWPTGGSTARRRACPSSARRRVYLAREPNGLETGLTGSINTEIIERAGGIDVAERGNARGGIANVSIEQVLAWAPDIIITWDAHFYTGYANDPVWAAVPAAKDRRVFLAPRLPFGWIDAPPSI